MPLTALSKHNLSLTLSLSHLIFSFLLDPQLPFLSLYCINFVYLLNVLHPNAPCFTVPRTLLFTPSEHCLSVLHPNTAYDCFTQTLSFTAPTNTRFECTTQTLLFSAPTKDCLLLLQLNIAFHCSTHTLPFTALSKHYFFLLHPNTAFLVEQ